MLYAPYKSDYDNVMYNNDVYHWYIPIMVLKPRPFNELGKEDVQGFWDWIEDQLRSNWDVSFNFFNIFDT